jgi:hypothetical protein
LKRKDAALKMHLLLQCTLRMIFFPYGNFSFLKRRPLSPSLSPKEKERCYISLFNNTSSTSSSVQLQAPLNISTGKGCGLMASPSGGSRMGAIGRSL